MEDRSRNRKRARARKRRQRNLAMKVFLFIIIIVGVIGGVFLLKKYGPTKEKADLNEYYGIQKENQLAVIVDNEVLGASGIMLDGKPYVEYSVVREKETNVMESVRAMFGAKARDFIQLWMRKMSSL